MNSADLSGVKLVGANLTQANLANADLSAAHLRYANLRSAQVDNDQLASCASLEGATMPNGQKYEDWLNSKGRGEGGENSVPS